VGVGVCCCQGMCCVRVGWIRPRLVGSLLRTGRGIDPGHMHPHSQVQQAFSPHPLHPHLHPPPPLPVHLPLTRTPALLPPPPPTPTTTTTTTQPLAQLLQPLLSRPASCTPQAQHAVHP